jgi:hypothetical protein
VKLNKQPGAKLALVASALAMLGAFFALVRSQPQIDVEASVEPAAAPGSYKDFFFPAGTPAPGSVTQANEPNPQMPAKRPHTRTRAS